MTGPRERRTFGAEPLTLGQAQVYLGSKGVRPHPSLGHRARYELVKIVSLSHLRLRDALNRIKAGEILSKEEYTSLKEDVKLLQHGTLGHYNGVLATTPVGATPLLVRDAFKPDLIIIDEAAMMDEASILTRIAHYSPKAWIVTGDIAQKPPHLTMEHDPWSRKVIKPFAAQKQTSPFHHLIESGGRRRTIL